MVDMNLRKYFYHDNWKESDERSDFHRKLAKKRSMVDRIQIWPNLGETIESLAFTCLRYFT
jgi:hypothetical protein